MSAFGQAGFGSMSRRNQLRAQGQMDPYGQQVRAARQAPTLNIYQTPSSYQQATGQQQAPRQSQPAVSSPPSPASPPTTGGSIPASGGAPAPQTGGGFPVYGSSAAPQTGGVMPTYDEVMRQQSSPGTAQPIQPQSQGTPYGADPGYADRVAADARQRSSAPAGLQKRDWEGNTVRRMLSGGLSPDMAADVLRTNSTRYSGDQTGAAQFANQTEQNRIASLSSGAPQAPGPNATADEVSAYFNASDAYGRQQQAQQASDERLAAEAAFNDPARTAAGPSQQYIDTVRRQQMNQGGSALMNPFAYRSQLQAGAIDVFGNQVTGSTPSWAMYNYQARG